MAMQRRRRGRDVFIQIERVSGAEGKQNVAELKGKIMGHSEGKR